MTTKLHPPPVAVDFKKILDCGSLSPV